MKRTLVALVEDKPGTLNRISSLFRRRAFNIESLTVGHSEREGMSRMTIVVDGTQTDSAMVEKNLRKLVNVSSVEDVSDRPAILHELALIKVRTADGRRSEVMQVVEAMDGRVIDIGLETLLVEVTGLDEKVDRLLEVLRPFGIAEMTRTGRVAMVREASATAVPE